MAEDSFPDDWATLTKKQQIAKCHEYAEEAERLARFAQSDFRHKYSDIAQLWRHLAAEIEACREFPSDRTGAAI
jgi:hypothetical protein